MPLDKGGIQLLDFTLQTRSLRLNRLRKILDKDDNSPWILLPRFYIARTISSIHPEWDFLANPQYPKYNGKDPPPYLRELPDFLRDNKPSYLNLKIHSTKTIYRILLLRKRQHTVITGQKYWDNLLHNLPWARIWKNTYHTLDNNRKQDILFKFFHNALPTGQRLKSNKGRYATNCFKCSNDRGSEQ